MAAKFDFDAPDCTCEYRNGIVARNMVGHTPPCPVYERWQAAHGAAYSGHTQDEVTALRDELRAYQKLCDRKEALAMEYLRRAETAERMYKELADKSKE